MEKAKKQLVKALLAACLVVGGGLKAQEWQTDKKINVMLGLAQPLLAKGFNAEADFIYNRFIFDYSHGASLDFIGSLVPDKYRAQHLAIHEPWTTGFGVGYRVREWINVRVEPKWHRFEFYYDGEAQTVQNRITAYTTFSVGIGVYGSYKPFKNNNNALKNIVIAPSIRFWPTLGSTLKGDAFTYLNKKTGAVEEIKRVDAGSNFTPVVFNVSIGYSFSYQKKK